MGTITENYDIVINERGGVTLRRTIDDIANSAQKAADGVGRLSNSADGFVSSLKKQADTLGFGRAQLLAYDAAQLKLTASQKASVDASIKQIAAFDKAQDAAKKNVDVLGSLKGQLVGVAAAYLSFTGVIAGGRAVLDAAIANERLMNTLTVGVGNVQAATREYAFLRQESDRLGLQFITTADQYAKLAAASKGTQLEGQATRDIFVAIAQASTVLGLSADQAGGALLAIQQMISKGKVSAEELRGQLGERLPGAFQIVARAIGVTTAELDKMLESGKLTAEVLLPAFAVELNKTFGAQSQESARGLNAQLNRLDNSLNDLKLSVGKLGLIDAFSGGIDFATKFVSVIDRATDAIGRLLTKSKQLPVVGGAVEATGNFLSQVPNALLGGGVLKAVDNLLPKRAAVSTALPAPEAVAPGSGIIRPGVKPEGNNDALKILKDESRERERLSKQLETQAKRELDSSRKTIDSLKLETKEIGLNAIQKKMLIAANEASKAPTEKLRLEIMQSAAAYGQLAQKQEIAIALEKDLAKIKTLTESVATPAESLAATTQELDRLKQVGLSQESYNRLLKKSQDELNQTKTTARDVFGSIDQYAVQAARNIQTSLANFLFNPFEDGLKGMVRGVADAVRRMLAEFAAMKIAQNIGLNSLFSMGGGAGGTGSTSGMMMNIASMGTNVMSGIRGGFGIPSLVGRGLSMLPGSIGAFGGGLAGTSAGVFSAAGGAGTAFIGGAGTAIGGTGMGAAAGLGSMAAAAAGPLVIAAAADMIFRSLAGDKTLGNKVVDSIPVIGSLGALLFGHGPMKFRQEALIGDASAEGFDGRVTDVFRAKGGLLVGNKHREQTSPNEAAFLDLFDSTLKGFGDSVKGFAGNLGLSADSVTNFSKEIDLRSEKGKRITEEAIRELLDSLGNELAGGVLKQIDIVAKSGETNIQTLERLSKEFDVLNLAALATGRSLKEARDAVLSLPITLRTQVIDQLGGLDAAGQQINFFIDNFVDDTTKFGPLFDGLNQQMQKLGFSASITRDEFTRLVQSVGQVGGVTQDQFVGLVSLGQAFDQVDKLRTKLTSGTADLVEKERSLLDVRNELASTYQNERSALEGTISRFQDLASQLKGFRESLLLGELSPLTPGKRLDEARQQFNEVRLKAASGDEDALAKLPNVAQEFLKASQTYNASGAAFVSDFNLVQNVLKNSESSALSQVDIAKNQLKALDDSVGYLLDIQTNTKTTADLIRELNISVLSGKGNAGISTADIQGYLAANPGLSPQQIANTATKFGVSKDQLIAAGVNPAAINSFTGGATVSDKQIADFVRANINNPMAIYNAATSNGISSKRLSSVSGIALSDIEKFVRDNGLPSFARGTDFISKSGLAMVHRAEAIVPSSTTASIEKLIEVTNAQREEMTEHMGNLMKVIDITNRQNSQDIASAMENSENQKRWNERNEVKIA